MKFFNCSRKFFLMLACTSFWIGDLSFSMATDFINVLQFCVYNLIISYFLSEVIFFILHLFISQLFFISLFHFFKHLPH